jgi:endonuclease-3
MNATKRYAIFETLQERNPTPETELEYATPFQLLVSVILSAQATDASVNKATRALYQAAGTPAQLAALGEEGIAHYIRSINFCRTKAKHVATTAHIIAERYGGEVPRTREALQALPGVGRKTANVVLNIAFGEPTIAVDTHIFRVCNRTGLAPGKDPLAVETALSRHVPRPFVQDAHHWLILHGRYVCKARVPECWHCVIEPLCEYRSKTPAPVD